MTKYFRQCRSDHSFYPEPALCTLRESLEGMNFISFESKLQSDQNFSLITETQKVDSEYEEWKEKIRIIITSFSAAAAGKIFHFSMIQSCLTDLVLVIMAILIIAFMILYKNKEKKVIFIANDTQ